MPLYKEYKGKHAHWAKKGTKGRAKPTGRIVELSTRRQQVWTRRGNATYSYERLPEAQATKVKKAHGKKKAKGSSLERMLRGLI